MIAAKAACAAESSAVVGSSSSHSGRCATRRRASATRRFCPAESARTGKSITWPRPTRASAGELRLARRIAAERARPEGEVFARGQRALQRVRVAEIMGLFADGPLGVAALEREAPGLKGEKAAQRPEEARLAGPVRPRHDQRRAFVRLEREFCEQASPAPFDRQVPRAKAHCIPLKARRRGPS